MIFDSFNHDGVLQGGGAHLHAARFADAGMWDVAIAGNFVRGIDDDDSLEGIVSKDAGNLSQHRGLADTRLAEQQYAFAAEYEVFDDTDCAVHCPADAQRQADYLAGAVAYGGDTVEVCALDACAVVLAERADFPYHIVNLGFGNLLMGTRQGFR